MAMSTILWLVLLVFRLGSVRASARFGAMEEAAVGFSPRYYLGASPNLALKRRQSGECGANQHSCADVGGAVCCLNTQYCIVGSNFVASCCPIGSSCGNQCNSASYQCPTTTTVSGTATVLATCCARSCPSSSAFKCASVYGGGCCSYGSSCRSGGACSPTAGTSSTLVAIVSEIPVGCTTSQFACASSLGGGCCNNGLSCTVVSNINYCASNSAMATRTGADGASSTSSANTGGSNGLSTGAKAGIGAGIAGTTLLILCAFLWFCISKRRNLARASKQRDSTVDMSQTSNSNAGGGRKRQITADYFGPTAGVGPFTDLAGEKGMSSTVVERGVPDKPHTPGDIVIPVEIDGRSTAKTNGPTELA